MKKTESGYLEDDFGPIAGRLSDHVHVGNTTESSATRAVDAERWGGAGVPCSDPPPMPWSMLPPPWHHTTQFKIAVAIAAVAFAVAVVVVFGGAR